MAKSTPLDGTLPSGGIPVGSVNLVAGPPGTGKTTLVHQILFHNAKLGARAIYFVGQGEPALKMLRHQQQFGFFDPGMVGNLVLYEDIGNVAREEGLKGVLSIVARRVEERSPSYVVIDFFRGLKEIGQARGENMRSFVHDVSAVLCVWNVTSFLLGEYSFREIRSLPEFSAADGIIRLSEVWDGNAVVRKIRVVKMRGQPSLPNDHTFNLDCRGIEVGA